MEGDHTRDGTSSFYYYLLLLLDIPAQSRPLFTPKWSLTTIQYIRCCCCVCVFLSTTSRINKTLAKKNSKEVALSGHGGKIELMSSSSSLRVRNGVGSLSSSAANTSSMLYTSKVYYSSKCALDTPLLRSPARQGNK